MKFGMWGAPLVALVSAVGVAKGAENTLQFAEDTAVSRELAGTAPTQVCRSNSRWIRVGFDSLVLKGNDKLRLSGTQGGVIELKAGDKWEGRSFYTRALRGSCVTITPTFANPGSRYALSGYQAGTVSLASTESLVTAAGDICSATNPNNCKATSDLVLGINPVVALTLGDNAYNNGTLDDYLLRYEPNWGRFKAITQPVPGNHEYTVANAPGYFDYYNGVGNQTGPAGDRSKGYYSFDVGDWHFIALNSRSGNTVAAAQLTWLDADLRANTKPCTAAYWHHAFISRGNYTGYATMKPFMDRLYASRADLALVAHDHNYQRWSPMDGNQNPQSDGVREIVVGTGGGPMYPVNGTSPLLERKQSSTYGILKLTLTASDYRADFVPIAGKTFTDTVAGTCNRATQVVPDFLLQASPSIAVNRGSTGGKIITFGSYGDFNAPIQISIIGLPTGVTATWSVNPVTPPADGDGTSRVALRVSSSQATAGTYPLVVQGESNGVVRQVGFNLIVR
ncbi:Alkaline phosphatase [Lysobacter dokdonensis DS-58]|uniref:Alkaline phosphatase n=1 Tax=Lysobacter dokdonensis DS-58 TaxID=1300345 RepID=A0A0A2WIM1_9GAMM|nr:metallophosphoesterase [Lysobacter dokdonensis]KGQ18095.1 Alkaline phosphatase [Lysobacter dokdonensis DS-58]